MGNKKYPVKIVYAQKELPEWTQLAGYLNMPIGHNGQHNALEFYEELIMGQLLIIHTDYESWDEILFCMILYILMKNLFRLKKNF